MTPPLPPPVVHVWFTKRCRVARDTRAKRRDVRVTRARTSTGPLSTNGEVNEKKRYEHMSRGTLEKKKKMMIIMMNLQRRGQSETSKPKVSFLDKKNYTK